MPVLFDLDGTLCDTSPGVLSSLEKALAECGIPCPDRMERFIGPPLVPAVMEYCGVARERAEAVLAVYRRFYTGGGMRLSAVYPGIAEMLAALTDAGIRCHVATSKPEPFAREILTDCAIARYFTEICGATLDEKRTKKDEVISELLRRDPTPVQDWIMVGDRCYDVEGAARHGIPAIGVAWGFGVPEEFVGAAFVADTPAALAAYILRRHKNTERQ